MKYIKLTQGQFAMVDDAVFEWLNQWKWSADKSENTYYALRAKSSKVPRIRMHCLIMGKRKSREIDHINDNGLDNRRQNLRFCTRATNMQKAKRKKRASTRYRGIKPYGANGKWEARIGFHGKKLYLGCFVSEKAAAVVYDMAAIEYYGKHAYLNFPSKRADYILAAILAGEG